MSWQLDVYTPDKSSLRASYTDTSPGGIVGGYQWSLRGDGAPLQMRWRAIPSGVDIRPRDVVQLTVDGQPAFFGVVTRSWPGDESDAREYIALGGIELLRYRSHVDPASYPEQDVAAIARQVISAYRHPAVTYDAALIPDTGSTIAMPVAYRLEVGEILDTLARSVSSLGVSWGVDAQGRAYFRAPTGSETVGYETADLRWEPEAGDEVVTRVDLVIATAHNPPMQTSDGYNPLPIVITATHPDDGLYGVQRVYAARGLLAYGYGPQSTINAAQRANIANADYAIDGNAYTYAYSKADDPSQQTYQVILPIVPPSAIEPHIYGVRIAYRYASDSPASLRAELNYYGGGCNYYASVELERSSSTREAHLLMLPPSCDWTDVQLWISTIGFIADDELRVYEVDWLYLDQQRATEYAQSLLRPPTQRPASVRWPRYHTPVNTITVTGAPAGDLMHTVREWRYTWTPERIETVAMLGDRADDDMTRAINRAASLGHDNALRVARGLTEMR